MPREMDEQMLGLHYTVIATYIEHDKFVPSVPPALSEESRKLRAALFTSSYATVPTDTVGLLKHGPSISRFLLSSCTSTFPKVVLVRA
jgi:hypothetical protein